MVTRFFRLGGFDWRRGFSRSRAPFLLEVRRKCKFKTKEKQTDKNFPTTYRLNNASKCLKIPVKPRADFIPFEF